MQTFQASGAELNRLRRAAALLKRSNLQIVEAKEAVDAAKAALAKWLKEERGVDVQTLPGGEMVQVEGVVLIEVGEQRRFDEQAFQLAEPKLHEEYKRAMAVRRYKPLV